MKEPNRLLIQGATEAERSLLRSASTDGPPNGAVQRMMNALDDVPAASDGLNLHGPEHGSGSHSPMAYGAGRSLKVAALAKVGLVALLGGTGLVAGVMGLGLMKARPASVERPAGNAPAMPVERALGSVEATGASQGTPLVENPTTSAPSEPESVPRSREPDLSDDSLGAELRILDVARAAVDARHTAEARRVLDGYAQRFPQGHLKPEATVLRLAVLVRQGNLVAAKSLGEALLASESYKTYEPRIRSLLREIRE